MVFVSSSKKLQFIIFQWSINTKTNLLTTRNTKYTAHHFINLRCKIFERFTNKLFFTSLTSPTAFIFKYLLGLNLYLLI